MGDGAKRRKRLTSMGQGARGKEQGEIKTAPPAAKALPLAGSSICGSAREINM